MHPPPPFALPAALPDPLVALRALFGFPAFREGQEETVRAVLDGEDVLSIMPTGAGKSLCYQLPAMLLPGCTVVVSPLIALMKDQLESLPEELRARAAVFNSTVDRDDLDRATEALRAGQIKLIYVAPERLRQRSFLHALAQARPSRIVVDEAHCFSLWGHAFRPDYLFLPAVARELGDPPLLLMTATATAALQQEIATLFGRTPRLLSTGAVRHNLFLQVHHTKDTGAKLEALVTFCREARGQGIVYASSREGVEKAARMLRTHGVSAIHYHAGLERSAREAAQDAFMSGQARVIVATVAFGMGVDKADVRFIAHLQPARSLEAYVQESGRAGRDGRPARCILFWTSNDKGLLTKWGNEDVLSPELMNTVYRTARAAAQDGFSWLPLEQLATCVQDIATGETPETAARVALGALEMAGVLRRHCDLPESARVWLQDVTRLPSDALAARITSEPGGRAVLPMRALAALLGCPLPEVEARLLALRDAGAIGYQGMGRGVLVELLPQPADLRGRLRAILEQRRAGREARTRTMHDYLMGSRCRTATIAAHFAAPHGRHCGHCDCCAPADAWQPPARPQSAPASPDAAPEDIIIAALPALPFTLGRTGLAKLLKGRADSPVRQDRSAFFGALAALPLSAITREIDALLAAGHLAMDDSEFRRLSVTQQGHTKPPAPWPPAALPPRTSAAQAGARGPQRLTDAEPLPPPDDDPRTAERFQRLRAWRAETAREAQLPPYTIFHDRTLHLLAAADIRTPDDLATIKGMGPAKLAQYGAALLDLLAEG